MNTNTGATNMSFNKPIRRIAVVGTGVIDASWAAYYLSRGFDVVATDPAPNAEASLRKYVDNAWHALARAGLPAGESRERLKFPASMSRALAEADLVTEKALERPEFKIKLFAEMDQAAPPDAILASSSSTITMDVSQSACKHPERCVIGHPFNPPHIVPLVEVVGGAKTSEEVIERAMSFYASIGRKPIRLHKAIPGHAANPLQAALYKEILSLIQQGVLDVADADIAVSYAGFQNLRGRLESSRGLLWVLMLAFPLPYVANTLGWMTAELGRQPWLVYGLFRTSKGHSQVVSAGDTVFTLIGFVSLYMVLGLLFLVLVGREIAHGPGDALPAGQGAEPPV